MAEVKRLNSWDSLVEQRIQTAQEEGQFDNLPGFGKRCPAIDESYDELWWIRRYLKREQLAVLPASLEIRRVVERELQRIWTLSSEKRVRAAVAALNRKIREANYRAVCGPASDTSLLDVDAIVERWYQQ